MEIVKRDEIIDGSKIKHVVYKVPAMQKSHVLVKIIEQENPTSSAWLELEDIFGVKVNMKLWIKVS